jgi:hypothetical protein
MPPDFQTTGKMPIQPKIISFGFSYYPATGGDSIRVWENKGLISFLLADCFI